MEDFKTTSLTMEKLRTKVWKIRIVCRTTTENFNKNEDSIVFSHDAIVNSIAEYNYMPEVGVTFLSYFRG